MINKELFEGPVGDYCIARNTIKCLFLIKHFYYYTLHHDNKKTKSYYKESENMQLLRWIGKIHIPIFTVYCSFSVFTFI